MDGISFLLSIGRPCWPKLQWADNFVRFVIGPFAFMVILRDMDVWFGVMSEQFKDDDDQDLI